MATATWWQEATMTGDTCLAGGYYATQRAWPASFGAMTAGEPALMRPSIVLVPWCLDTRLQEALIGPAPEVI